MRRQQSSLPNADKRVDLQSFSAQCKRNVPTIAMFSIWVGSLFFHITMVFNILYYILLYIYTYVQSSQTIKIPIYIQIYISCMFAYAIFVPVGQVNDKFRISCRYFLEKYPLFQYHACIFEDEVDTYENQNKEKIIEPALWHQQNEYVKSTDRTLFCFHPHGVLSVGLCQNGVHSHRFAASKAVYLVHGALLILPILSEILRALSFDYANKTSFQYHLSQNHNICMIPGGFEDAALYQRHRHRICLKKKFGFLKLALQHGYTIRPIYTFGEEETFHTFPYFQSLRLKFTTWSIPGVFFWGKWWCMVLPMSTTNLITVVGKPIQLPKVPSPTSKDLQKYHTIYVNELQRLFDRYKVDYASDPNAILEIF